MHRHMVGAAKAILCIVSVFGLRDVAWAGDCACVPCDFDRDEDVDQTDFAHLQKCLSGTGIVQSDSACADAKLAGHAYVDQQDVAIFRGCLSGEQEPYPGTDLPPVVISELLASNEGGLADEDGDHPDWIEITVPCEPSVNLDGWFLTDDEDDLQKWPLPAVTLVRGQYLVIFASGKDRRNPANTLHTNFQLDKGGEYLALVGPGGQAVIHAYTPSFPEQLTNVSYGLSQISMTVVAKGAQAWYHVPTEGDAALGAAWTDPDYPDSGWGTGLTGLGFSSVPSTFQVNVYKANVTVGNLAAAESVLADPAKQTAVYTSQMATINMLNTGGDGHFTGNQTFPGLGTANVDDYVSLSTGTVVVPSAGEWTFGVNSDEGFKLTLTQGSNVFTSSYPDLRTAGDTMGIFNVTQPGIYALRLEHFDRADASELELFAAPGYHATFDSEVFRLVGDTAGGGLAVGGLGADVLTGLASAMCGVNSSVWVRIPFNIEDPALYTTMKLRIRYVDGFVAYLNGQEVASRNAPAGLAWNSAATSKRTGSLASTTEEIDLAGFHTLLRAGRNVLALHGLNDTVADGDFAIVPELVLSSNGMQHQYFTEPTPGAPNGPGGAGFVETVEFDQQRGFRSEAFSLNLSCPTPGAAIRYTLDGSTPTESSGFAYSGPIAIGGTSVVRAAGFKTGYLPSAVMTQTYLFVNDVIRQSPTGLPPGPGWPSGSVNGQVINYGMDPDVVDAPAYSALMDDALLAIPSLSLVTDLGNLFSATTGIYTHASGEGEAWERPCSLELINPGGSPGFQINAGVRIRGGFSRSGGNPKHAFRLFFRSRYGQNELQYPLFESEGVSRFKHVDLRCEQNYSWSYGGDSRNTAVREVFCRDTQGAMGQPYTRSRHYHLYIDGVYWGLYMTEERPEADYAASYFGGEDSDYDVVKVEAGSYTIEATDGDTDGWYAVWQACQAGFASDTNYYKAQGLNVDGTRNPAYDVLVDVDNTIDCALITYYSGDLDGPISAFLGNGSPNNFYVIHNRDNQSGFKCFKHDCEHTLLSTTEDRTGPFPAGQSFAQFNPQYLSQCLADNAEYRMRFADRVQKFCFNGGLLTPENATARFLSRAAQIQTAIIAESARWGDAQTHPPLGLANWQAEIDWIVNSHIPVRTGILLDQLKADGLYPSVSAPLFSNYGGQVQSGYGLTLSKPSGSGGTIYYTTDGSDPRLRGGAVSPSASTFIDTVTSTTFIPAGATWRYLDNGSEQGTAWRATGFSDSTWAQGAAELGYGDGGESTTVGYGPDANNKYITTYFRKSFTVPSGVFCTDLVAAMICDDGAAIYLNGHAPVVTNMQSTWDYANPNCTIGAANCLGEPDEYTYYNHALDASQLNVGNQNVLAVEVHQCNGTSSDMSFKLQLTGMLHSAQPIAIDHNMTVKARIRENGQWSALVEAVFVTQPVGLVINEFMADNGTTIQDPDEPGEYPDWIEIYNPNPIAVSMGNMYLTDNFSQPTKFQIAAGVSIPAHGRLVFWADGDTTQGNLHTNFSLSKDGERIGLYASDGTTAIDQIVFGAQSKDVSYGRYPDGGSAWGQMVSPTPGMANGPLQ